MKLAYTTCAKQSGSATAYALLAHLVRTEYGIALPRIEKTENGKPFFPDRPDIHFSLSHTAAHVLCAVSSSPVGVDIEAERVPRAGLERYFCSDEELALFDWLDLWVLKESCIKLLGGRLLLIKKLRFSRDGDEIIAPDPGVHSRLYRDVAGCRMAVCALGESPPAVAELVRPGKILSGY